MKVEVVRFGFGNNLVLELDPSQICPDDPGSGTPAMVYMNGDKEYSSTYWFAIGEGYLMGTRDDFQLSERQLEWLQSLGNDNFLSNDL